MTGSVSGRFEARGDTDWYRVQFEAGKTYRIGSGNGGAFLKLMLADGTEYSPPGAYSNEITFVAPVSGDYWLAASDSYTGATFYSINAFEIEDANPASSATTLTLAVGEQVAMTGAVADDWYAVDLTGGQSYFLDTGLATLYVMDAQARLVSNVSFGQLHFSATDTGRYYVGIRPFGGNDYTLSLNAVADDYGTSAAAAGNLTVDGLATGLWEAAADRDWFAVSLTAGTRYRFVTSVTGESDGWGSPRILDADGQVLAASDRSYSPLDFTAAADGVYYLEVTNSVGLSQPDHIWQYSVSVAVLLPPPSVAMAIGETVAADWQSVGERDVYSVTLTDSQSYSFTISTPESPESYIIALMDKDENVVASGYWVDATSSTLNVGVAKNGTYYLTVASAAGAGDYILTSQSGSDDYLASSLTTGTIAVGGTATGTLEGNGDSDWFAVTLTAHKSYAVYGGNITIRDAQGNALNNASDADLVVSPATSGIYYLDVSGEQGDYVVSITELTGDIGEDTTSSGIIGTTVVGADTAADRFVSTSNHEIFLGRGGDDVFIAGEGHDRYIGGLGIDRVTFADFAAGVTVDLSRGGLIENGALRIVVNQIENVEGSAFDDRLTGDDGANRLIGGLGNDQVNGGAGDDRIFGGDGNDRLEGGAGRDYLDGGAGVDSVSYEHAAAGVVVSLAVSGAQNTRGAGVDALTGFENIRGSAFDDRLTGDDHSNTISGLDGADVMIGLFGDDVYYVDNVGDKVVEKAWDGYDTVIAAVDYTLSAHVEALTLSGRANIDAIGNGLDNVLTGNVGDNRLRGGAGADTMIGGAGDDIYYIDNAGDRVVEKAGEGHDLIVSSVDVDLRGTNVEDVRLIGSGHLVVHGNDAANNIRGNASGNTLWGGDGNDVLTGGAGIDNFVFDTALGANNVDRITDFTPVDDVISLFRSAFGELGGHNGSLAFGAFQTGSVATEADDRILYDAASGNIFYDADGSGAGAAVLFAQVTPGLTLSNFDFIVLG
ncbi:MULTISPECIES: calcium-binding protein [Sphingobium]|uniref:Peptidase C-terminal archaeal/bacterial domain-containing protein n=1 Tax=Sphingobium yanoikuyae ATCC 51230 TaxID=883163 RepID=K9CYA5_SPHYA|nr:MULTISPECIES: calcium-binding protein [Sphingobium]EKU76998.1 hypothetical protein HMPREF9718_00699 [Sphingobium yanoikuyae ATCC 51230]WQE05142.1 calcium-binding protein [Sphingobium yanoikuyae]SHM41263.1 Ca2+-binding protein, RTX toxin-related [Sphingobium sp. YR657]